MKSDRAISFHFIIACFYFSTLLPVEKFLIYRFVNGLAQHVRVIIGGLLLHTVESRGRKNFFFRALVRILISSCRWGIATSDLNLGCRKKAIKCISEISIFSKIHFPPRFFKHFKRSQSVGDSATHRNSFSFHIKTLWVVGMFLLPSTPLPA